MNLNLLTTLKVLLETRHVGRAAEQLCLSQPSISKQLTQLRRDFDDPLLVREGAVWRLTPRAEALRLAIGPALEGVQRLYAPPQFDPAACRRTFRLASSDYVAQYILPQIGAALAQAAPHATLEYLPWDKSKLSQLAELPLDLVSTLTEQLPSGLVSRPQGEDGLAVLMRLGHPLSAAPLTRATYLAAPHIRISGGGDKEGPVDAVLAGAEERRHWFAQVPFFQAAVGLLQHSDSLLTTPAHIAWQLAQDHDLLLRPLPFVCAHQHYHLIWPQRLNHEPAHQWFRELAFGFLSSHLHATAKAAALALHHYQMESC